ncbi:putative PurR-regulated permease PerM [Tenacibaculum adriaticum]|uniref:Putative PurR-regulated permease PerM n=1 Tax=Tenacibaculum adriaticum TaxID=413713 RepID=A0A5S5DQD8_9FLAO|nr:AI-2E family transporter [Tenacibaculum adriaticum]TYP98170.1 putative PurR-regulated permease PerM [Tenacibaculum adriaticum]
MNSKLTVSHRSLALITVIAVVFILYVLKPLIMPLLLAMILGVMIFPVQKYFEKKWRCDRLFSTIFSICLIFSITALIFLIVFIELQYFVDSGEDYSIKISALFDELMNYLVDIFSINRNKIAYSDSLDLGNLLKGNSGKVMTFIFESGSFLSNAVLIPVYLFFFLYYRRFFRAFTHKVFKNKSQSFINTMINKVYRVQKNYLAGLIKVMLIVGILNTIALLILGIEKAIFFGFFAALLLLIPYIGIIIGALLPAVVALATKDSAWYAFGVIAIFGFIQFLEGNFITPKVTGSEVSLNSFVTILSLIAFAMLWGISGMIVALPITATIKIIFDNTPGFEPYGFVMGQPIDIHLKTKARQRLKVWKNIRKKKLLQP